MSLNKEILMGKLTAKPVLMNGNQVSYTRFSVAVNEYNSKTMEQTADFIQCAAFQQNSSATTSTRVLRSSSRVLSSRITTRIVLPYITTATRSS